MTDEKFAKSKHYKINGKHFPAVVFSTIRHFSVCKVFIDGRFSTVRGDIGHKMYPTSAVHQRIFNQMIQILH